MDEEEVAPQMIFVAPARSPVTPRWFAALVYMRFGPGVALTFEVKRFTLDGEKTYRERIESYAALFPRARVTHCDPVESETDIPP